MQFDGAYGYVEMDLCETDLLKRIVESPRGRLLESESFLLFYQLTRAIRHCHNSGIYHRDIKPENVLITKNGMQVKLTDFGTALSLPAPTKQFEYDGYAPGSPSYLAPELLEMASQQVFQGEPPCFDPGKADVYSLGATLFAMVAGRTPWSHDSPCHKKDGEWRPFMPAIGEEEEEGGDGGEWLNEERVSSTCTTPCARTEENLHFPPDLSDDLKDLLKGMLALKPSERLCLEGVWAHRWMQKQTQNFTTMASQSALPQACGALATAARSNGQHSIRPSVQAYN